MSSKTNERNLFAARLDRFNRRMNFIALKVDGYFHLGIVTHLRATCQLKLRRVMGKTKRMQLQAR